MAAPKVQLPDDAVGKVGDVLAPSQDLLQGLNLLLPSGQTNQKSSGGTVSSPDPAVAVIESSATALTKVWATILGVVGGGAGLATWLTNFWNTQHDATRVALIAAGSGLLAAVVIGVAIMVSADVRGRAAAASATYEARSRITAEFLKSSQDAWTAQQRAAVPPPSDVLGIGSERLISILKALDGTNGQNNAAEQLLGAVAKMLNDLKDGITPITVPPSH